MSFIKPFLPLPIQWKGFFSLSAFVFANFLATSVCGQNTGVVFSPEVSAGVTATEFRTAYDDEGDQLAYRIHLQHGFSDSFSLRGIGLQTMDSSDHWDFRYFRLEGLWQFLEDETAGWDSALRFDLQIAEGDDLPSLVRIAWSGRYDLDDYWQIGVNVLTGYEIGPASDPGVLPELRAQVARRLSDKFKVAFDYYGNLNNSKKFGSWETQKHEVGPMLGVRLNDDAEMNFGALFGISQAASDTQYRFALIYKL